MARDDMGRPRGLAGEEGYRLEKAPMRGCWFLINEATGKLAIKPNETTAFAIERAIRFLRKLTDRQIAARQPAQSGARMRASVYRYARSALARPSPSRIPLKEEPQ